MFFVVVTVALLLASSKGLVSLTQSSNIRRTVASLPTASEIVTANLAQDALRPRRPFSTVSHISTTSLDASSSATVSPSNFSVVEFSDEAKPADVLISTIDQSIQTVAASSSANNTPASSTSESVGIDVETRTPNVHSQYVGSVQTLAKSPSTTLKPSATTSKLNLQPPKGEAALKYSISTSIPPPTIEIRPGLPFDSQTIIANSKSQFLSGQPLFHYSTVTRGSRSSSPVLDLQVSSGKTTITNSPSISFLGTESTGIPALLTSSQTVTADDQNRHILIDGQIFNPGSTTSLGQYNIDGQILTPSGVITVSGTTISLTPDKSDVIVGTSTEALSANNTASFGAGSNVTAVETFKGSALGARNGLWSSSMVVLAGITVLLWF